MPTERLTETAAGSRRSAEGIRTRGEEIAAHFPALMIEAERIAQAVAAGVHGRRRAGPGENFWQHRPYAFGDPVSSIDWRQSARASGRLYVRQNEWEAAAAVWIWPDASASLEYASARGLSTKRRRVDVLATALAILLSRGGERVGLIGARARPFHGRAAPSLFLEALLAGRRDRASSPPVTPVSLGARIILLSDFFAEPDVVAGTIRSYARAGATGALVQVVDPAEEDFPFQGRTDFQDTESKDHLLFGDAAAAGADYRTKFTAHREELSALARRFGWTFIAHRTDRPAQTPLLALYAALADRRALR